MWFHAGPILALCGAFFCLLFAETTQGASVDDITIGCSYQFEGPPSVRAAGDSCIYSIRLKRLDHETGREEYLEGSLFDYEGKGGTLFRGSYKDLVNRLVISPAPDAERERFLDGALADVKPLTSFGTIEGIHCAADEMHTETVRSGAKLWISTKASLRCFGQSAG